MHEVGIVQNILQIARDEVQSRGLKGPVEKVLFRVGRLNAVIPDILTFNFDVLKKDVPGLENACLDVEEIPLRVRCEGCGVSKDLEEPVFICLECGSPVEVETGQEMWVERITLKEES